MFSCRWSLLRSPERSYTGLNTMNSAVREWEQRAIPRKTAKSTNSESSLVDLPCPLYCWEWQSGFITSVAKLQTILHIYRGVKHYPRGTSVAFGTSLSYLCDNWALQALPQLNFKKTPWHKWHCWKGSCGRTQWSCASPFQQHPFTFRSTSQIRSWALKWCFSRNGSTERVAFRIIECFRSGKVLLMCRSWEWWRSRKLEKPKRNHSKSLTTLWRLSIDKNLQSVISHAVKLPTPPNLTVHVATLDLASTKSQVNAGTPGVMKVAHICLCQTYSLVWNLPRV